MSYSSLLLILHTLFASVLWTFVLWFSTKIIRWGWFKRFAQLWIDFMIISLLTLLVLISNPVQNAGWIMLSISVIYFFLYYFANSCSIGARIIWGKAALRIQYRKLWLNFIFLIFLAFLMVGGKGKSMVMFGLPMNIEDGIGFETMQRNGQKVVQYDNSPFSLYDMLVFDQDMDGQLDTIIYDINKDGFVDQIVRDIDNNGLIDSTQILSYHSQRWIILVITLLFAFVASFMFQLQAHESSKQISAISQQIAALDKELQKPDKKNKKSPTTKEQPKTKKKTTSTRAKKITKVIAFLSLLGLSSDIVLAQAIPTLAELQAESPACINEPFNDEACLGVDPEHRLIFQHLLNPVFQLEIQSRERRFEKCRTDTALCQSEEYQQYIAEFEEWRQGWTGKTPLLLEQSDLPAHLTGINELQSIILEVQSAHEVEGLVSDLPDISSLNDLVREIVKSEKGWGDINSRVLQVLNHYDWEKDSDTSVGDLIRTWQGSFGEGLKTDHIIFDIYDTWQATKGDTSMTFEQRAEKNKLQGKLAKTLHSLNLDGIFGMHYLDYLHFHTLAKQGIISQERELQATRSAHVYDIVAGSNPVDIAIDLLSAGLDFAQLGGYAEKMQNYKLSSWGVPLTEQIFALESPTLFNDAYSHFNDVWSDDSSHFGQKIGALLSFLGNYGKATLVSAGRIIHYSLADLSLRFNNAVAWLYNII